jgi:hypothetical protein
MKNMSSELKARILDVITKLKNKSKDVTDDFPRALLYSFIQDYNNFISCTEYSFPSLAYKLENNICPCKDIDMINKLLGIKEMEKVEIKGNMISKDVGEKGSISKDVGEKGSISKDVGEKGSISKDVGEKGSIKKDVGEKGSMSDKKYSISEEKAEQYFKNGIYIPLNNIINSLSKEYIDDLIIRAINKMAVIPNVNLALLISSLFRVCSKDVMYKAYDLNKKLTLPVKLDNIKLVRESK